MTEPVQEHIMQFFKFDHLPEQLRAVSMPFAMLAGVIVTTLPRNPERTVALRKLLEAKDAAVRAALAVEVVIPLQRSAHDWLTNTKATREDVTPEKDKAP